MRKEGNIKMHRNARQSLVYVALAVFVMVLMIYHAPFSQQVNSAPCTDCHLCPDPTIKEPCLKECFRSTMKNVSANQKVAMPGVIRLGKPGNIYEAVIFDHEIHAQMGNMGKGCIECHHYSSTKRIPPCRECHENPISLSQPGLKGAYHRQCMECHTAWSHSTACDKCHLPVKESETPEADSKLIASTLQSHVSRPVMKLYDTPYPQGHLVTFYHNQHAEVFGLQCVDCHHQESCGNCHNNNLHATETKSQEEIHNICNECHKKDKCTKCHDTDKKDKFMHNTSKWRLGLYHESLACRDCHMTGQRITSFVNNCVDCHKFAESKTFSHRVTGLELDEIHAQFECNDCHADQQYHSSQTCNNCHDDNRTFKNKAPGKLFEISLLTNNTK